MQRVLYKKLRPSEKSIFKKITKMKNFKNSNTWTVNILIQQNVNILIQQNTMINLLVSSWNKITKLDRIPLKTHIDIWIY
jgi:hypothetical protein